MIIKLATASETSPTVKLMDELRAVFHKEEYDHVTIAALIGILEMLKYEALARNME